MTTGQGERKSEFKPVKLLKIDLESHPAHMKGLGMYICTFIYKNNKTERSYQPPVI